LLINLFWPIPAEGLKGFDDGKTGRLNPMKDGAVVTRGGFTLNETGQVVEVAPVLGIALSGKEPAIFFEVR
jgi:hypothetical protein